MTILRVMRALLSLPWTGMLPSQLCTMAQVTTVMIWNTGGGSSTNPHITCTRSCLSSKNGMSGNVPAGLAECSSTSGTPTATDIGLCAFIAATNIAFISGYSAWQCTSAGTVSSQPCTASSSVWSGVTCQGVIVTGLSITSLSMTGE